MSGYWAEQDQGASTFSPRIAAGPRTGFLENFEAARLDQVYNNNGSSEYVQYAEAYDERIREIKDLTGQTLDNPITSTWLLPTDEIIPGAMLDLRERQIDEFEKQAETLRKQYPQLKTREAMLEGINTRAQDREARMRDIDDRRNWSGLFGGLGGTMVGSLQDPLVGSTLFVGAAKGLSILKTAALEAGIAMGIETAVQPNVQTVRTERGLDAGFTQGAVNVVAAGAGAGVFAGLTQGAGKMIFRDAVKAADDTLIKPAGEVKVARDIVERAAEVQESSPLSAEAPGSFQEHGSRLETAMKALEEGAPVDLPPPAAALDPAVMRAAPDHLDGVVYAFDPATVDVDAKTFQFKAGGDDFGVTDRLKGVTQWDPVKAGQVVVYEYADGRRFIADGHQRLGLAKRLQDSGQQVRLYGQLMREADGFTPGDVRVAAAMKNIAEGTGTAVDAAKVLRAAPERIAELPRNSALVRQAIDLRELSDEAFGAVVNEVVPANYAAIVGRLVKDEQFQTAVLDVLAKTEPANVTQAESIVRQAVDAGGRTEMQESLFGEEMITTALFGERAKVLDKTIKRLRQDRGVFDTLVRNEDRISAEGNVLQRSANAARAETDARAMQMIQTLANRKGPLSDALTAAARRAADDKRYTGAVDDFVAAVRAAAERDDFAGLETGGAGRADGPSGEIPSRLEQTDAASLARAAEEELTEDSLALFDEPAGKGPLDQTKAAESEIKSEFSDVSEDMEIPVGEVIDADGVPSAVTRTVREVLDELDRDALDLQAISVCGGVG